MSRARRRVMYRDLKNSIIQSVLYGCRNYQLDRRTSQLIDELFDITEDMGPVAILKTRRPYENAVRRINALKKHYKGGKA